MEEMEIGYNIQKNPETLHCLQNEAPILFAVLRDLPVEEPLLRLFKCLKTKVKDTFRQDAHALKTVSRSTSGNRFSYLPNWPVINERGANKQDLIKSNKKKDLECTKDYRGHPTLMPGIFTLYCKHGEK